jgi:hypothetical protein
MWRYDFKRGSGRIADADEEFIYSCDRSILSVVPRNVTLAIKKTDGRICNEGRIQIDTFAHRRYSYGFTIEPESHVPHVYSKIAEKMTPAGTSTSKKLTEYEKHIAERNVVGVLTSPEFCRCLLNAANEHKLNSEDTNILNLF